MPSAHVDVAERAGFTPEDEQGAPIHARPHGLETLLDSQGNLVGLQCMPCPHPERTNRRVISAKAAMPVVEHGRAGTMHLSRRSVRLP